MKKRFLIAAIISFCIAALAAYALGSSETTNLGLTKPTKGDRNWGATVNNNMDLIDAAYGNYVSTADDLPQVYVYSDTFNSTTGTTITLPNEVDAVTEYSVSITPTTRAGAIGDIYVTKTTTNFVVKCSEANTTDTFAAVVYYTGDASQYGGSIYRRWYVSPDSSITDHGNASTTGSLAWVAAQISTSPAIIEMPGNKNYQLKQNLTLADNISYQPQMGAIIDTDFSIRDSNYEWYQNGATSEYYLQASGGGNPNINMPGAAIEDGAQMTDGAAGSLAAGEWDWNDVNGLGYTTVYVRLSDSTDPDGKSADYVEAGYTLTLDSPSSIFASARQQIFNGKGNFSFTQKGEVSPNWWEDNTPGTTDMSFAINTAIGAGCNVRLLKEIYLVKSAVAMTINGASIGGEGTIKCDTASFGIQTPFISITADDCIIEDITIDGDDNATGWMVHVSSATNARIRRTIHTNVGQAAIIIGNTAVDTHVDDCYQKDEGYGVLVDDPSGSSGLFVKGNHFEYDGSATGHGDGVEINAPTNGFARFNISNNYIAGYIDYQTNHGMGIGVANGSDGVISGNIIENVEADGIHIENNSHDIIVSDNVINNTGPTSYTADGVGIFVAESDRIIVETNNISSNAYAHGISVQAYPDTSPHYDNKITNNTLSIIARAGIRLEGQQRALVAGNNIIGASQETTATYSGIELSPINSSSPIQKNNQISNNIIADSGNSAQYAIEVAWSTIASQDIRIVENDVTGCTNKIFYDGTLNTITLKDNKISEGALNSSTYSANQTLEFYEQFDYVILVTAAATISLRQVAPDMRVLVYSTTAAAVSVKAHTNDRIILDGLPLDDADKITSASGAGNFIELVYESANGWATTSRSGVWTDGGP